MPRPVSARFRLGSSANRRIVVFVVYDGPPNEASCDLSLVLSAEWTPTDDGYADLVLGLADGSERRHKVATRTAVFIHEQIYNLES